MKTRTTDNTPPVEILPSQPIQIPQVDVIFTMPRKWVRFVNEKGINIAHKIDCFVTDGFPGRIRPEIRPSNPESFSRMIAKFGDSATLAMNTESGMRISMTIRRDIWELFLIEAANVGESPLYVLMILIAKAINFEKTDGAEIRELMQRMRSDETAKRASNPIAKERVVTGPWKPVMC